VREATAEQVETRFGPRVRRLVVSLSDTTVFPKPPWKERKLAYIALLRDKPAELKLISAADKHHNASSILRDYRNIGDALWDRFTADRDGTLWYYRGVVDALGHQWQHPLLDELRHVVTHIHTEVGVTYERG
jgi:(p)ppGpp synthase/HD superfamily hydrolase